MRLTALFVIRFSPSLDSVILFKSLYWNRRESYRNDAFGSRCRKKLRDQHIQVALVTQDNISLNPSVRILLDATLRFAVPRDGILVPKLSPCIPTHIIQLANSLSLSFYEPAVSPAEVRLSGKFLRTVGAGPWKQRHHLSTKQLSDPAHVGVRLQPGRDGRVRAWLGGHVRNLIHAPQKYIRVTEIREDTNSTLRGQSCRSTSGANANERNANTAKGTSIPNLVTNIHGAGK